MNDTSELPSPPDIAEEESVEALRHRLEQAERLAESYRQSLALQGLRASGLAAALWESRHRMHQLQRSVSWRVTTPLRYGRALAAGRLPSGRTFGETARHIAAIYEDEGATGLAERLRRRLPRVPSRRRGSDVPMPLATPTEAADEAPSDDLLKAATPVMPVSEQAESPKPVPAMVRERQTATPAELHARPTPASHRGFLRRSVLIVAELSIPQCSKYRVWQKQEHFRRLGVPCRVLSWHEFGDVISALQLCTEIIFYRVPGVTSVLTMIAECRRLGLSPWWEVDDLIFDEPLYRQNSNLKTLAPALREEVLKGVRLYRAAMLACGRGIASTTQLAQQMRDAGLDEVRVVENALDEETIDASARLRDARRPGEGGGTTEADPVTIVYGSGTKTHDADFAVAAAGIAAVMRDFPGVRLRIVGELGLPDTFAEEFEDRIEILPGTGYRAYLGLLAAGDIAIAPLEDTVFNDCKSNIKFQEAAMLGMPSVCSPSRAFREAIRPGETAFLAADAAGWQDALEQLVRDAGLRRRMGAAACADVLEAYAPDRIARTQAASLVPVADSAPAGSRPMRVLSANIFFWPRSFGGATIVAEEMARRLHAMDGVELCVFTSRAEVPDYPHSLMRYDWNGIPMFGTSIPDSGDQVLHLDNPAMMALFGHLLDAVRPDVVHAHSIQGFGAGILRACSERGIPYVVTLHDAWWLCDRQFMVTGGNRYCFQTHIDLRTCQNCLPHARHLAERMGIMKTVLNGAAMLLSPSASHRSLYLANDMDPARLAVNRNGVRAPSRPRRTRPPGGRIRFGYVGGNEGIKGIHLIRRAFEKLPEALGKRWELVMVDNTLNLGFRSIYVGNWKVEGLISVIPAYTQDSIDSFFDGIDVLLFPSQWKESYGLTVREALLRDVWVIATEGGGQAEDVEDGVNGRLVPLDGTELGLLAAIRELLDDPGRLDGFSNPFKSRIATFDGQAAELRTVLATAAAAS
ncbi:glycosyltransferase [Rhizosaccharibacter radicis]|uniref:Glycosyltransferase n=1 Tax=Rhizosaccharibacter radicis TaxID=2782605 RepID=A0ABT1VZD6_9PROT|nr:glycosyltransferase [Acetobacteraceae bacterium KSS12]